MKNTAINSRLRKWLRCLALTGILLAFIHGPVRADSGFALEVLDVGQGLCVLIEADGHFVLYDGGGRDTSSFVVSVMKQRGIDKFDLLVASHYDEDHLCGLVGVLRTIACDLVLAPGYESDTAITGSFYDAAYCAGVPIAVPSCGDQYFAGGAVLEVTGPPDPLSEQENDRCIAMRIEYGDTAFWLGGDSEETEEVQMVERGLVKNAEVYVAHHHGSASSSTRAFLQALSPEIALISCGAGNDFGHPSEETLQRLAQAGCAVLRTDLQGSIRVSSDGDTVTYGRDEQISRDAAAGADSCRYICNLRTGVFHRPGCASAAKMYEGNRLYTNEDRETLIARGGVPCGVCRP